MIERPARGERAVESLKCCLVESVGAETGSTIQQSTVQTKNAFTPGKTENEGIQRILTKPVRQAGLILLFVGEAGGVSS
jgi:hypothetical protein